MKAFVRNSQQFQDATFSDIPTPQPGPGEVLMHVAYCGLCGSDIRIHDAVNPPLERSWLTRVPIVAGHEFSGEIVEVGEGVDRSLIGTHCVSVSIQPCGKCSECRNGFSNVCSHRETPGVTYDGGLAEYCAIPVEGVFEVPRDLPLELAALVEPMSVAVHAAKASLALPGPGKATVSGPGPIGIFAGLWLLEQGWDVTIIGREADAEKRLSVAARLGMKTHVDTEPVAPEDAPDFWVEASGAPQALTAAIQQIKRRGLVSAVGIPHGPGTYDFVWLARKEVTIRGSYAYELEDYASSVALLQSGRLSDLEGFVDLYPLDETVRAIDDARDGHSMKPMIDSRRF